MRNVALHALLLPLALPLLSAGCNGGSVSGVVRVRGKVSYGGQPIAGATVTFISESDARPAVAVTDASGVFQLKTLDTSGAIPGRYTVLVTKTDVQPGDDKPISMDDAAKNRGKPTEPKQQLPAKYADPTKSPLKVEITKGKSNSFDLSLTD